MPCSLEVHVRRLLYYVRRVDLLLLIPQPTPSSPSLRQPTEPFAGPFVVLRAAVAACGSDRRTWSGTEGQLATSLHCYCDSILPPSMLAWKVGYSSGTDAHCADHFEQSVRMRRTYQAGMAEAGRLQ